MEFLSPEHGKYKNILQKNPRSMAFAPLGDIYRKYAMMDEALEVLQRGIRYNPDYVPGHLALARCYYDQGRYDLCHSTLKPFVHTNRDNFQLQNLFLEVCEELELWQEALEACKQLHYLNPKSGAWTERIDFLKNQASSASGDATTVLKEAGFREENLSGYPGNTDEWSELNFFDEEGKESAGVGEQNNLMEVYDKKFGSPKFQEDSALSVKSRLQNFCDAINKRAASFLSR